MPDNLRIPSENNVVFLFSEEIVDQISILVSGLGANYLLWIPQQPAVTCLASNAAVYDQI